MRTSNRRVSRLLVPALALLLGGCASTEVIIERRLEPQPSPDSAAVLSCEELARAKGRGVFRVDISNTGEGTIVVEIFNVDRQPVDHDKANTVVTLQPGGRMDLTMQGEGVIYLLNRSDKPATARIKLN